MSTRRIAELAGISQSAVSLALANSPKISSVTKRRVLAIARRVGYRPNAKVAELMSHLRQARDPRHEACLGVISLYDIARPWESALHFRRIHDGMTQRANALGYRLEPFWLRAPGMTTRRLRAILDARGIQGLLSFGSPQLDDKLPQELDRYAIVTQGVSMTTPLHRVVTNAHQDMWRVLRKIHDLGYRRPGLVLGGAEGARSAHAYLCVYLGWCHLELEGPPSVPVLRMLELDEKPLIRWIELHRPDVMLYVHHYSTLSPLADLFDRHGIRVPDDLGVVAMSQILEGTVFSGMQGDQHRTGAWAVELLVSRIMNRDFGFPSHPRVEMVDCQWVDGRTLRRQKR